MDDAPRMGRPVEVTTEDKVAAVRAMEEEDARVTVAQLVRITGISAVSVVTILHHRTHSSNFVFRGDFHRSAHSWRVIQ